MNSFGPPLGEDDLKDAERQLGAPLPLPIRSLLGTGDGRFDRDGQWWVVWTLADLVPRNLDAWDAGTLPRDLVAFGDDGTGNPFCVLGDGSDQIVRWSWIDQAPDLEVGTVDDFEALWLA